MNPNFHGCMVEFACKTLLLVDLIKIVAVKEFTLAVILGGSTAQCDTGSDKQLLTNVW